MSLCQLAIGMKHELLNAFCSDMKCAKVKMSPFRQQFARKYNDEFATFSTRYAKIHAHTKNLGRLVTEHLKRGVGQTLHLNTI